MKRNKTQLVSLALLLGLFAPLPFTSCSKDDEPKTVIPAPTPTPEVKDPMIGTWSGTDSDGDPWVLRLNDDSTGTISLTFSTRAQVTLSERFNWTTSSSSSGNKYIDIIHTGGDYLLMDEDDSHASYVYVVAGDRLSFGNLTFTRM